MRKTSLAQQARDLGINVDTLKRHMKQKREADKLYEARRALQPTSAGWNPRAGVKKAQRD